MAQRKVIWLRGLLRGHGACLALGARVPGSSSQLFHGLTAGLRQLTPCYRLGSGSAVQMLGYHLCMVLWGPANYFSMAAALQRFAMAH